MDVSMIVPCYNGARFLRPLLSAISNQTRPADEILVIDDGSTDGSPDIVREFQGATLIQNSKNMGLARTRNVGTEAASGDILIFADVDAYPDPEMIEALLAGYENDNVGGVGGAGIESNIQTLADRWRRRHASQNSGDHLETNAGMLWGLCSSYRKSVLQEVGGFDPFFLRSGEDVDMSMRVIQAGYRLVYTPKARVYHQRTDSISSLFTMMRRWYYWGYLAQKKNRGHATRYYLKTVSRGLLQECIDDLFYAKSPMLAMVSAGVFINRLIATVQGMCATIPSRD